MPERFQSSSHRFIVFSLMLSMIASISIERFVIAQEDAPPKQSSISLSVKVTLEKTSDDQPVSGRLLVFFSKRESLRLIAGPNWFQPEPFFGVNVDKVAPGTTLTIDDSSDGFPSKLSKLERGKFYVQAVLDQDFFNSSAINGRGNIYSKPKIVEISNVSNQEIEIPLTELVDAPKFEDTSSVKFIDVESPLLTEYLGRPMSSPAAVVLPDSYDAEPDRRYPVYYEISGFGGTLNGVARANLRRALSTTQPEEGQKSVEFIRVILTGQCKWGHHVYANSKTNGPRGDALVHEVIPYVDEHFRTIADPKVRFVGGHSSGGWSSLWLQVNYPDTFGGVWSTAPDPVDFRDFQRANLYLPDTSIFVDEHGSKRPLARRGDIPVVAYESFSRMDDVIGRGGQLRSFEAVFSPLDTDGSPKRLWNRTTGSIDPEVAEYWKRYDISLILKDNWSVLGPKLQGKIRVYMGDMDTFYLDGATRLLAERMKELKSDAVIEMFPGRDHGTLLDRVMLDRIKREMKDAFLKYYPDSP